MHEVRACPYELVMHIHNLIHTVCTHTVYTQGTVMYTSGTTLYDVHCCMTLRNDAYIRLILISTAVLT